MTLSKREQSRIERRLIDALTEACEAAKAQMVGFDWLTHEVDYQAFPRSLRVIWVFDTQANKAHALASGQHARMLELTAAALAACDIALGELARHLHVDCEQDCAAGHGGDWGRRIASLYRFKG